MSTTLGGREPDNNILLKPVNQQCSFVQVLSPSLCVVSDPLPRPVVKGYFLPIKITEEVYVKGIKACKTNLDGRLVLSTGDKSCTAKQITAKLMTQWKTTDTMENDFLW